MHVFTLPEEEGPILIHNVPQLQVELGRLCKGWEVCDRTGRPHDKWALRLATGKVVSFATGEEREYPKEFCSAYAAGLMKAAGQEDMTFLEVFSGPNAPLSCSGWNLWSGDAGSRTSLREAQTGYYRVQGAEGPAVPWITLPSQHGFIWTKAQWVIKCRCQAPVNPATPQGEVVHDGLKNGLEQDLTSRKVQNRIIRDIKRTVSMGATSGAANREGER